MTQNHKYSLRGLALAFIMTASASLAPINAKADQRFQKWIADFYQTAAQNGISKATYRKAFSGVSDPDPTVLEKAAYQPEFTTKIWDYIDSRVNPYTVQIGRKMGQTRVHVERIERHFGVDKTILLAIWSMESNYGAILEKDDRLHYVPRALATLAYADQKRAKFARSS
jgi:membrane-bound lytic murein transglycosylase B